MQTEGQYRVGISFNPSADPTVDYIKMTTAELIDALKLIADSRGVGAREAAIAMTEYESAAMWAVKAFTKPARDLSDPDPVGSLIQQQADQDQAAQVVVEDTDKPA